MKSDLNKKRSQSCPNCCLILIASETNNFKNQSISNSVHNQKMNSSDSLHFHQYNLRNNRSFRDDLEFDQTTRSTNYSNLNQTQRKKQRKEQQCDWCNVDYHNSQFVNCNNLPIKTDEDHLSSLPDEILFKILTYLRDVRDVCRISQVSKKFYKLGQDSELWKSLYQEVYEYDLPIVSDENTRSKFRFINNSEDFFCEESNLWKFSFKQFYRSIHVRKDSQSNSIEKELHKIKLMNLLANEDSPDPPIVFIHKGIYKESLIIETNGVKLIGAAFGSVDTIAKQVIIENDEHTTVHFSNGVNHTSMSHMTLIFKPEAIGSNSSAHHHHHALLIDKKAKPTVFDCIFHSSSKVGATVCVLGESTEPTIKNCQIVDCSNVGIFVDSFARGNYEKNLIARNALAGVWVKNNADPVFLKNTIKDGQDVGVFCFDSSLGWFEKNDIHGNRIAGFEVKNKANPTVIKNKIHHGRTGGIYCLDFSRGIFLENKIYSNNFAGIWITGQSNPTIRNNEIYDGLQGGIYLFEEGKGVIEHNNIHNNALAGIQIRSLSDPVVRFNSIHSGKHGGMYLHQNSKGLIEQNEIYGNEMAGIWVTTGSSPIIRANRIHSGKQVGVYFYDNGNGILEENEIFNHLYSGIQIRTDSNPIIKRNKIWGGRNGGVLFYNSGNGILEQNEIFENAMANVWIKTDSNPTLIGNKIYQGKDCGICINSGKARLIDNNIFLNQQAGVLISSQSEALLKNNRIHNNYSGGVEITNNAHATLKSNQIYNNKFGGLLTATDVKPYLENNRIFNNENTVEKTIQKGQCLYKISNNTRYPMHDFYRCRTCKNSQRNAICRSCINLCHADHDIEYIRFDRFFCDCGSGTLPNQCKLIESTQETGTIYESSSPTESKSEQLN